MAYPDTRIKGPVVIDEYLTCKALYCNEPSIDKTMISPNADIPSTAVRHRHQIVVPLNGSSTADAAAVTVPVFLTYGVSGTILAAKVVPITGGTGTTSSAEIDLLKNGSSILTATRTLTPSDASRTPVTLSLSSATLAAGDILEGKIVSASAGDGAKPKGVFLVLTIEENGTA